MEIKIEKTVEKDKINDFITIILKNKLHLPIGGFLFWIKNKVPIRIISIAYVDGTAIGAAIILEEVCKTYGYNMGVFVKEEYRKNGIGTELVKAIKNVTNTYAYCKDNRERITFFKKALRSK